MIVQVSRILGPTLAGLIVVRAHQAHREGPRQGGGRVGRISLLMVCTVAAAGAGIALFSFTRVPWLALAVYFFTGILRRGIGDVGPWPGRGDEPRPDAGGASPSLLVVLCRNRQHSGHSSA